METYRSIKQSLRHDNMYQDKLKVKESIADMDNSCKDELLVFCLLKLMLFDMKRLESTLRCQRKFKEANGESKYWNYLKSNPDKLEELYERRREQYALQKTTRSHT